MTKAQRLTKLRTYGRNRKAARAYGRVYMAGRYTELKAAGLCVRCGQNEPEFERTACGICLACNAISAARRKLKEAACGVPTQ
jgi:hypothetical protein